jgi:hypothetical protein
LVRLNPATARRPALFENTKPRPSDHFGTPSSNPSARSASGSSCARWLFIPLPGDRHQPVGEIDLPPVQIGDLAQPLTGQDQEPHAVAPGIAELAGGGPHGAEFVVVEHPVARGLLAEHVLLAQRGKWRGADVELARADREVENLP